MSTTLSLPTELTIYTVGELRSTWLAALDAPAKPGRRSKNTKPVQADALWTIAAAAVEQVDAAGVQLLLALKHALVARQRALQLIDPSSALRAACDALGAGQLLTAADPRTAGANP